MRRVCVFSSMLLVSGSAAAYDIKTNTPLLTLPAIHEMMTRAAIACVDRSMTVNPAAPPKQCWDNSITDRAVRVQRGQITPLEWSVRWPDDPTRQGVGTSYPKLGLSLWKGCKAHVSRRRGIDSAGLLCSSHYGRMQFLHAMRGIDDRSSSDTRARIFAWARFAYEVAAGDDRLIESSLCDAVAARKGLADALTFDNPAKCHRRPRLLGLFGHYPPYTVRTLFTLTCRGVASSTNCDELKPGPAAREEVMRAATGSLLHLIQDSYSQAHNSRSAAGPVNPTGPFEPKVVCRFPTEFFDYSHQQKEVHGAADHQASLDPSCLDSAATDDAVTASAVLLWHLRTNKSADDFVTYLRDRVIGP